MASSFLIKIASNGYSRSCMSLAKREHLPTILALQTPRPVSVPESTAEDVELLLTVPHRSAVRVLVAVHEAAPSAVPVRVPVHVEGPLRAAEVEPSPVAPALKEPEAGMVALRAPEPASVLVNALVAMHVAETVPHKAAVRLLVAMHVAETVPHRAPVRNPAELQAAARTPKAPGIKTKVPVPRRLAESAPEPNRVPALGPVAKQVADIVAHNTPEIEDVATRAEAKAPEARGMPIREDVQAMLSISSPVPNSVPEHVETEDREPTAAARAVSAPVHEELANRSQNMVPAG